EKSTSRCFFKGVSSCTAAASDPVCSGHFLALTDHLARFVEGKNEVSLRRHFRVVYHRLAVERG
ncbi:MAG: hypothetical protein ACRD9Y_24720, partial [Blastocatellia bacterium]